MQFSFGTLLLALSAYLVASIYGPVNKFVTVVGLFRTPSNTYIEQADDFITFPDTVHCEDLHHHLASNLLFTACEDSPLSRFEWFPPLSTFVDRSYAKQGSIHVLDPTVWQSWVSDHKSLMISNETINRP